MPALASPQARTIVDAVDDALFTDLAELAALAGGAPWGGVFLMDSSGARRGSDHGDAFPLGLPSFDGTPCALVLESGAPVVVSDVEIDGRFFDLGELTGLWSYAGVPVYDGGELIGTACVGWKAPLGGPVDDVLAALERVAGLVPRRLELHRAQTSLRTIVATLSDGLMLQDGDGRTLMSNPAFSRMLELPGPEQLEGLPREHLRELIARSPVGAQRLLERSAEVFAAGHAVVGSEIELANGRTLEWDFLPAGGEAGDARRVWHIRDVTARRAAERRAAASERRFNALAGAGMPTTAVFQLGPDGMPMFMDDLCQDLFDLELAAPDDPDGWTRSIHDEDRERVAQNWASCTQRQTHYSDQYRVTSRGRVRHVAIEAAPMHDGDGAFAGFVGTMTDITQQLEIARARERSEALAQREHQRLSDLVAGSPEPILSVGPGGRIVGMNPAALSTFGMTRHEALGKPLTDLVAGADRPYLRTAAEEAAETGVRPGALEVLACGVRPRMFLSELVLIPMRRLPVEDPDAVVLTAIFRDISDQHRANLEQIKRLETERVARVAAEDAHAVLEARLEELHAVTRAKDTFVSMISHELRTPLTSIRAFAELLAEDDGADEDAPVAVIHRNVERLERIVGELLEVKTGIDPSVLHLEETDLRQLVRHEVAAHRPAAAEAGVRLEAVDGAPVPVCADPGRIGQVVGNLVDNALKFTPAGESVVVDARRHEGAVLLEVRDTGCGIAPEELPRVFERFYQGGAGRSLARGSGLGLSIAALIAEAHGGQMDVSSRPGEGTTFTMTLPPAFED